MQRLTVPTYTLLQRTHWHLQLCQSRTGTQRVLPEHTTQDRNSVRLAPVHISDDCRLVSAMLECIAGLAVRHRQTHKATFLHH